MLIIFKHFRFQIGFVAFFSAAMASSSAADIESLRPLLTVENKLVMQTVFSAPARLQRSEWIQRQGTRWTIGEGVLQGIPSTKEFQDSKPNHKGYEARVSLPATPQEFAARFSIRFIDGVETRIVPFIEFSHHVARIKFSETGLSLVADGETVLLNETKDFKYKPGHWYHLLAEMKGDEFVVQFANGPTLYGRHTRFKHPATKGGVGLGIAGPRGGSVELDNLTLWSVKKEQQPSWIATKSKLGRFKTRILKQKKQPTKRP
ncbi:hypothetical protein N8487_00500 [bacterium]|jgi:hypothetical protein|nr:hypothetical protein [bacterium]MDA7645322.1 hypothetical protein [bacterium]MDB4745932.1 hypothetical protein [Verrucomicrobiota bacterium]MDB4798765.1 hypothetical protein [Verrucomicrobiota bacterium]